MFGQLALEPALGEVHDAQERDHASERAWNRFSWLKLASHVAFAVPWFIGRRMLSGREVSRRARALTRTKDFLVGASLITGVTSFVIGRVLGRKALEGEGPERARAGEATEREEGPTLERTVSVLGGLNLLATAGVLAVTTLLAMEANKSIKFSARSRWLP